MTATPTRIAPLRVAMWSGPRNISTAMMRAFENRSDTAVWDEPFYAYYLAKTGLHHPMHEAVIAAGESEDWRKVVEQCTTAPLAPNRHGAQPGIHYQKHMTHHMLPEIDLGWLDGVTNAFLIRKPEAVLASYHDRHTQIELRDVGFQEQADLFDRVADKTGAAPAVLDSDDVLADPEGALQRLCASLSIAFDPAMLSWPAGKRDSDGVWAAHWYASVEASTGLAKPRPPRPLPDHLAPLAEQCRPYYDRLAAFRI